MFLDERAAVALDEDDDGLGLFVLGVIVEVMERAGVIEEGEVVNEPTFFERLHRGESVGEEGEGEEKCGQNGAAHRRRDSTQKTSKAKQKLDGKLEARRLGLFLVWTGEEERGRM